MIIKILSVLMVILAIWVWPISASGCMGGDCSSGSVVPSAPSVDYRPAIAAEQQGMWEASANAFLSSGPGTMQPTFGGGGYGYYPGSYQGPPLEIGSNIEQNNKQVLQVGRPTQGYQSPYQVAAAQSDPMNPEGVISDAANPAPLANPAPSGSILAKAQELASQGDPTAIKTYLANQGYRMDANWCGDFAAAVVSMAGGTPPKDPQLADNWRNWGTAIEGPPQPGDVAVKIHQSGTHGHVTFVESYDPKTGKFVGLGGNQGRWRGSYKAGRHTFRRPPAQQAPGAEGSIPGLDIVSERL